MTAKEYAESLRRKRELIDSDRIMTIALGSAVDSMGKRIFEKGQDVGGGTRSYDTQDEIWVPDNVAPKAQTNTGKTGKPIKTTYYSSYSSFRSKMGRQSGKMNFRLNNDLQSDLLNGPANDSLQSKPRLRGKFEGVISLKRTDNQNKANGLESRFGSDIFKLSKAEVGIFTKAAQFELNKILTG